MASSPTNRFRTTRSMPSWVTESSDRVGPPPPPLPINPDPDYEVIDVSNQQYSNAPPPVPLKLQDIKRLSVMKCDLCGSTTPAVCCEQCDHNLFCASCDDRYHRHPKRQQHIRKPVELPAPSMVKPPLPPKGDAGSSGPLPPPRRNKRPGSFHFPSPMLGRKEDQTIPTTVPQTPGQQQKPPQPPPSPALSLREKMNSLKRLIHPSNRPLPDPPENKIHSSNSSLESSSKRSPSFAKSVSSTMEKIQNNTAATLDRMTLLQQRYRQHQETMKADGERSRRASLSSNIDLQSSATESSQSFRTKPPSFQQPYQHQLLQPSPQQQQQHHHLQSARWLSPSAPRIRSGSVASGINLLPSPTMPPHVPNDHLPSNNEHPFVSPTQRPDFGPDQQMMGAPRSLSTSVFNLNQHPAQPNTVWGFNPLHQAQSMAHFNQMQWNQMNPWMMPRSQNGSNMSLNMPSGSQQLYPPDQQGYPPGWNNNWGGGMYPYPMGMMPMMPGVAMPPPRSRGQSRSRAASPALSVKSRKSTMSMRNLQRNSYIDDLTDDEDSDQDFPRSHGGGRRDRRRERLNSTSSMDFEEPEPSAFGRTASAKHSRFNRERRGNSSARSMIDYPVTKKAVSRYDRDELGMRDRFDKMSLASPRKPPSDSFTNESDFDFDRRTSTKSRSGNESISSPGKGNSDSMANDSDAVAERRRLAKVRAGQPSSQTSPRRVTSDSLTNDSDAEFERRKQQKAKQAVTSATAANPTPKRQSSDSEEKDRQRRRREAEVAAAKTKTTRKKSDPPRRNTPESHTPDGTDGEQRRRFVAKKYQRKNSSTEFIANESDDNQPKQGHRTEQEVVNGLLEIRTTSPAKPTEDDGERTHRKQVELKNIINESRDDDGGTVEDTDPPVVLVAPDRQWECEFCTYVNEAGVKICAICCKTATLCVVPDKVEKPMTRSPPPDVVQEPPLVTEVKLQLVPPTKVPLEAKKKDDGHDGEVGGDRAKVSAGEDDESYEEVEEEEEEEEEVEVVKEVKEPTKKTEQSKVSETVIATSGAIADSSVRKENGDIRQNLNSEMVKVEKTKIVKEKVSTGCGPSPPRDMGDRQQATTSIGTSPPPQDMSTQTYDTLEKVREEIATLGTTIADDEKPNNDGHPTPSLPSALYKRSYSIATPQLLQVDDNPRPGSRLSISSDTQSLPPSPHELSPQPSLQRQSHHQHQTHLNQAPASAQQHQHPLTTQTYSHHDENMSYLDRAIHEIIQTAANQSFGAARPLDNNKYRTFNDLRRIEPVPPMARSTTVSETPARKMLSTTMDDQTAQTREQADSRGTAEEAATTAESEETILLKEAERHNFTTEDLKAAISHCGDKHPVQWLRDNWTKLIETVQTLATKYGHEKRENTIGTISTVEAREALRMHNGNIWRAITECIEQRQRTYREIASKGNFTREDIVTSLTAHHGDFELAMIELSKTQLKPFLMRIWGPPSGADNESGNLLLQQALLEDRSGISSEIADFITQHVKKELLSDGKQTDDPESQLEAEKPQASSEDCQQQEEVCDEQHMSSNTAILKDIEALIEQMERNREPANSPVLRNIQQLLSQMVYRQDSPTPSVSSVRSHVSDRVISKSPIPARKINASSDPTKPIEDDVRDFVQDNIQDILPSLVGQVRREMERKPKTLEDDIRETLMNAAEYSPEVYANVHYFPSCNAKEPASFPQRKPERTSRAVRDGWEDDNEYDDIQKFLQRAVRNEGMTTEFEQFRRANYRVDSSSDEARMTADSTDYYDLVSFNQRIMNLLNSTPAPEQSENRAVELLQSAEVEETQPLEPVDLNETVQVEEQLIASETMSLEKEPSPEPAAISATPIVESVDKKMLKKRRGSRIPVNKNNYLYRRPVKSSSESDFENLVHNSKPQLAVTVPNPTEEPEVKLTNEPVEQTVPPTELVEVEVPPPEEFANEPIYMNMPPKEVVAQVNVVDEEVLAPLEETKTPEAVAQIVPQTAPASPPRSPQNPEVIDILQKQSNNLSDLVLDTKRLIQQMKDEINSDIATIDDAEEGDYEDGYYEEFEDEWSDGEEGAEEEWDSNEEYDVDENGDFYEYEDDDDDGSVMFSEMTIINSNGGRPKSPDGKEEIVVHIPDEIVMPKMNLELVREIERNSASEVSDLPLDSDFNDTMSVIDQSIGEIREMFVLANAASLIGFPEGGALKHASSVETLQNSPEPSEATLKNEPNGELEEASERTLVPEENANMTMKEVQSLLNAKAVIGGFIKSVQMVGQEDETQESRSTVVTAPKVITGGMNVDDSIRTSSTDTTENRQPSVIEVPVKRLSMIDEGSMHGEVPLAAEGDGEIIHEDIVANSREPGASVAQDPPTLGQATIEHQDQVMETTPIVENLANKSTSEVPPTEQLSIVENGVNLDNQTPVAVLSNDPLTDGQIPPTDETLVPVVGQLVVGSISKTLNSVTENPTAEMKSSTPVTTAGTVNNLPVENAGAKGFSAEQVTSLLPQESIQTHAPSSESATNVENSGINPEIIILQMNNTIEPANPMANGTEDTAVVPVAHSMPETVQPKESMPPDNHGAVIVNGMEHVDHEYANVSHTNIIDSQLDVLVEDSQSSSTNTSMPEYATVRRVKPKAPEVTAPESPDYATVVKTNAKLAIVESSDMTASEQPAEPSQTSNDVASVTGAQILQTLTEPAIDHSSPVNTSNLTNGHIIETNNDTHQPTPLSHSRASSEDRTLSIVEFQPSDVIVHLPVTATQITSPPEVPPRTGNIYQNVDIPSDVTTPVTNKSAKLTVTIPAAVPATPQSENGDEVSTPETPPTPTNSSKKVTTTSKTSTKAVKTDAKKKSTATDSSSRKQTTVRKKSVGSAFGPVQTNTVKNMQKEFLSKVKDTTKVSPTKTASPKPAKLVQPKAFTNKSAKPAVSDGPGTSKASTPASDAGTSSARSTPGPSYATPGTSRESSTTNETLLKKKYRETCFSDDYMTTDDEDESRMTITESERTIIKSLVKAYEPNDEPPEVQARQLLDEGQVQTIEQAELAVHLIGLRYARDNAIWAATQCHTIEDAKDLLQKECELCLGKFPMNEIVLMLKCTHTCCLECAKEYFTQEITNRSITNCNCPYCKEPDLNGAHVTEDDVLEYFSNLDILLKNIVDEEVHDLFQRKIRDRTLMQDVNFKWCVDCSSGFFARPKQKRLICPDCGSITCASCRKPWETQHEGLTCEKFTEWKEANDPELQAQGVARHLQAHGISCPNCRFRYSLARGGCMHFTCTQCKFEFCYGCNKPFMMGAKCTVSPYCAKLGLHAHHPRNCLFYLRDKDPHDLQNLLVMNNVQYDTEPTELMKQELLSGQTSILKCPIPLQKETPAGLMDTICNGEVPNGHAGLCKTHYVEYLVGTVSRAQIDPLPILDLTDCVQELRRRGIPLPERGPWDTDPIYREMCQKIVKDQIPLN